HTARRGWPRGYHTAFLVRLSSNRRYSHRSVFEREPDIGDRAPTLVHAPLPGRRKPPVLDGRADHRGPGPRPRDLDGLPAVRRRQETGAAPVRLLRTHGHRGERLPSRTGPGAVPARYVPGVQAGLPARLRPVQESALRESRRQHYTPI